MSDNGIVLTCGDGSRGCLGHGDWTSIARPRLIEALLSVNVTSLAVGHHHVVAVGSEGEVYSWGHGTHGRLGLGTDDSHCQPMEVPLPERDIIIRDCRCGKDGTVLITDVASILACGNNEYNKLGLNQRQGFLMSMKNMFNKGEVGELKTFTVVKALARHRVLDVSLGPHHTCVLVEPGHIYTLGRNTEAQLGNGNTRLQVAPTGVKMFQNRHAVKAQCGEYYTVAATVDNELLFWGRRCAKSTAPRVSSSVSVHESSIIDSGCCSPSELTLESLNVTGYTRQTSTSSTSSLGGVVDSCGGPKDQAHSSNSQNEVNDFKLVLQPDPLLRMDFSGEHCSSPGIKGDAAPLTVMFSDLFTFGEDLYIQVETTAPPLRRTSKKRRRKRSYDDIQVTASVRNMSVSSHDGGDEYSSEASEFDSSKNIPAWLKHELVHCTETEPSDSNEAGHTTEASDDDSPALSTSAGSMHMTKQMEQLGIKNTKRWTASKKDKSDQDESNGTGESPLLSAKGCHLVADRSLSSSGSSDVLPGPGLRPKSGSRPVAVTPKRASTASVSRAHLEQHSVQPVPPQKPLARIRANAKKRADGGTRPKSLEAEVKCRQQSLVQLQMDMKKLGEEKRATEERLLQMEAEQSRQQQHLLMEAAKKSSEREQELKQEVKSLRQELQQQSSQLHCNQQLIISLQEQLLQVQREQQRLHSEQQSTPRRESRICCVQ